MRCLICAKEVAAFETYGLPPKIGRCPECGAKGRHRLIGGFFAGTLKERLKVGSEILEAGPSKVTSRHFPCDRFIGPARFTAIDIQRMKHHGLIQSPHRFLEMSATDLKFDDHSFDLILCNHVLPYIPDARTALKEFHRCLKPQGLAVLNVHYVTGPTREISEMRILDPITYTDEYLNENGTEWLFGEDYFTWLKDAGFHVKRIQTGGLIPEATCRANGLKLNDELILGFASEQEATSFKAKFVFP